MKVEKTPIEGLVVIEPQVFNDSRGYFMESYNKEKYAEAGITADFVQDNQSHSVFGVVRGLHFQRPPFTQAKLVTCTQGKVLDVAVDLRKDSPTYKQWYGVVLSDENHKQFFILKGFAHGFCVLSNEATFNYKCDEFYHPEADGGILLTDKKLGIDWPIKPEDMILSEKDTKHPTLDKFDVDNPF